VSDGCNESYYKCKKVLMLSVTCNMLLVYLLAWVTGNLANPIIVSLGWMGLGLLVAVLVAAYVSEDGGEG